MFSSGSPFLQRGTSYSMMKHCENMQLLSGNFARPLEQEILERYVEIPRRSKTEADHRLRQLIQRSDRQRVSEAGTSNSPSVWPTAPSMIRGSGLSPSFL